MAFPAVLNLLTKAVYQVLGHCLGGSQQLVQEQAPAVLD
jgi:hypothetical protein